jgi:hypothetical protein
LSDLYAVGNRLVAARTAISRNENAAVHGVQSSKSSIPSREFRCADDARAVTRKATIRRISRASGDVPDAHATDLPARPRQDTMRVRTPKPAYARARRVPPSAARIGT